MKVPNVGFMVLIRNEDGSLSDNWDGVVHPSQAKANDSCIEAKRNGYDAFTVSLISRKIIAA